MCSLQLSRDIHSFPTFNPSSAAFVAFGNLILLKTAVINSEGHLESHFLWENWAGHKTWIAGLQDWVDEP